MRCFCAHVKGRRKISLALSLLIGFILIAGAALAVPVPILAIKCGRDKRDYCKYYFIFVITNRSSPYKHRMA